MNGTTIGWIAYFILDSLFTNKNKRYLTKTVQLIGLLKVHKFSCLKEFHKVFILATAVYDQKQVIFNQKPINRLALLTGALRPQTC